MEINKNRPDFLHGLKFEFNSIYNGKYVSIYNTRKWNIHSLCDVE